MSTSEISTVTYRVQIHKVQTGADGIQQYDEIYLRVVSDVSERILSSEVDDAIRESYKKSNTILGAALGA